MTIWFTARAAGLAALILLSIATALGAATSGRRATSADGRVVMQYLHRITASLGLGLLVVHVATILADSFAGVGVTGAIVPFTSSYRATWVGLGTIAVYLFLLVSAFGFARGRVAGSARAARTWRAFHCLSYGGWALAVAHGFMAGSDSGVLWVRALYLLSLASVLAAVALRLSALRRPAALIRTATPATQPATTAAATQPLASLVNQGASR